MVLFLLNEAVSRDVTSGANRIKTGRRRSYSYSYSNAFKPIALEVQKSISELDKGGRAV
jgi:hypothetical protein